MVTVVCMAETGWQNKLVCWSWVLLFAWWKLGDKINWGICYCYCYLRDGNWITEWFGVLVVVTVVCVVKTGWQSDLGYLLWLLLFAWRKLGDRINWCVGRGYCCLRDGNWVTEWFGVLVVVTGACVAETGWQNKLWCVGRGYCCLHGENWGDKINWGICYCYLHGENWVTKWFGVLVVVTVICVTETG